MFPESTHPWFWLIITLLFFKQFRNIRRCDKATLNEMETVSPFIHLHQLSQPASALLLRGFENAVKHTKALKYLLWGLLLCPLYPFLCSFFPFLSPSSCSQTSWAGRIFTVPRKRQSLPDRNAPAVLLQGSLFTSWNFSRFLILFLTHTRTTSGWRYSAFNYFHSYLTTTTPLLAKVPGTADRVRENTKC